MNLFKFMMSCANYFLPLKSILHAFTRMLWCLLLILMHTQMYKYENYAISKNKVKQKMKKIPRKKWENSTCFITELSVRTRHKWGKSKTKRPTEKRC